MRRLVRRVRCLVSFWVAGCGGLRFLSLLLFPILFYGIPRPFSVSASFVIYTCFYCYALYALFTRFYINTTQSHTYTIPLPLYDTSLIPILYSTLLVPHFISYPPSSHPSFTLLSISVFPPYLFPSTSNPCTRELLPSS